jgi:hypothetical protein
MRGGEDFTALAKFLKVRDEGATKIVFRFSAGAGGGNAARHVRGIGQVAGSGFFDNDEIFFHNAAVAWTLWSEILVRNAKKLLVKTSQSWERKVSGWP